MSDLTIQRKMHSSTYRPHKKTGTSTAGFGDVIKEVVKRVNDMEIRADQSVEKLLKGQVGIHETMIALQKADISLRLLLQIRNKAMDAYREIMRMQF
ncbi:MAG: flagellar hook-basal body complex protein FliE [Desulfobacterales bacterium]|nr:flagellar hook-basal body complex protein FliE [Desulfobacterales bacterium]